MLVNSSASQVNGGENSAAERQREPVNRGENCARAKRILTAKVEAKMRAKRASELRLYFNSFLKWREGGPKGRPSEVSLKSFWECGLILVNVWSDQIVKIRKLIVWSHATYFLPENQK